MRIRFVVSPIVAGREQELAALEELGAAVAAGKGHATLIGGEAGVGKTRLAAATSAWAKEHRFLVFHGECIDGAGAAYAPLVTALRRHLRRMDADAVRAWFDGGARLAVTLLPEVAADLGVTAAPTLAPEDLDAAVLQLLDRESRRQPVLLLLEDLHWAGPDMLRLFSSLVRECAESPVWLLATYRTDELHRRHPLTAALATLTRERRHEEIQLAPLAREPLRAMLSAVFDGTTISDEFLAAVHDKSGGNPFFVEELCRVLIERGDVYVQGTEWARRGRLADLQMPATLGAALLARAERLPAADVACLRLAAVAGEVVDRRVLALAAELEESEVRRVIGMGIDHQLLVERREDQQRVYAFRHSLTRELLAQDLVGPERQDAHARVAAAMLDVHRDALDAVAGQVADHAEDAGDRELAAELALRAARAACALRAPDAMIERYQQAVRLTSKSHPDRLALLIEAAEATVGADDRRAAESFARDARGLGTAREDPVAVARALRVLSQARWWAGDHDAALSQSREAMRLLEGRHDRWEVWALSLLARRCALVDREDEARELVGRALPMAEQLAEHVEASRLHDTLAVLGGAEEAVSSEWDAALLKARAAGDVNQEQTVLYNSGNVALWQGNLALARARLEACMAMSDRLVSPLASAAGVLLAWVEALSGRLDQAVELVERHRRGGNLVNTLDALTALGEARLRAGAVAEARALAEQQWGLAQSIGENQMMVPALAALARVRLCDSLEDARPLFDEALARARVAHSARLLHWTFSPDMARALQAGGRADELAAWAGAVAELTEGPAGHGHNRAAQCLCEGLAAHAGGDLVSARLRLREAAERYQAVPCPARQAEALLGLAECEITAGDAAAAAQAAAETHDIAQERGMPQLAAQATGLLRRAGVRVRGRRSASALPGGLSEREGEVAVLIARGCSNAEVGRRLFLSELTARNHVSNILAKLNLRTRAEVARWTAEVGLLEPAAEDRAGGALPRPPGSEPAAED